MRENIRVSNKRMMTKSAIRDLIIIITMLGAFAIVQLNPVEKVASGEKIQLDKFIPREFPSYLPLWKSISYDMSGYKDQWQSINELLVRKYYQRNRENIDFIKKRVNLEVTVFSVSDKEKSDPENKSRKAKLGKPALYLE